MTNKTRLHVCVVHYILTFLGSFTNSDKHPQHPAQPAHTTMLSDSLYSLARSKLHLSTSSKDSTSLHRWVLIKNSIVNSLSSTTPPALPDTHNDSVDEDDDDADEVLNSVEVVNSFMFPDAGKLVSESTTEEAKASEAQWLDSLLETLGDDDDDDFNVDSEHNVSTLPADDDEFPLYSPIVSPMSSSDDLPSDSYYPTSPISVPYPPYHPPLIHAYDFTTFEPLEPLISSFSAPYEDPLPYHNLDDLEDVPDAIEDTSDDESDAPTTPSLGRSSSSLTLDPASVPLPAERSRLRHSDPRVYIDGDDQYFCFEFDPLPFPDEHLTTSYNQC